MTKEEKLLRLSLIGVVLSFYKPNEQTKTINKIKKNVRKAMKSISKAIGTTKASKLIYALDPHWKAIFEKYESESVSANILCLTLWDEELEPYVSDKLLERYSASEIVPSELNDVEQMTYKVSDDLNQAIKEVLNEKQD